MPCFAAGKLVPVAQGAAVRLMPLLASEERLGSEALGAGGCSPEPCLLLSCLLSLGCSGAASLAALSDSEIEGMLSGGDAIAAKCRGRMALFCSAVLLRCSLVSRTTDLYYASLGSVLIYAKLRALCSGSLSWQICTTGRL